ncbi:cell division protein PerM [Tessaracoccus sp. G1721]
MATGTPGHRTVAVDIDSPAPSAPREWPWPWYLVAVGGPVAVLLAGWIVLGAFAAVGWLASPDAQLSSALQASTRVLLAAHGAPSEIGGIRVSMAPLGLTGALVFLALPVAAQAARRAARQWGDPDVTGGIWADTGAIVLRVGGTFAGVYAAAVFLLSASIGVASPRAAMGGLAVGVVAGFWGASRGVAHDPTADWPDWLRAVPRALGAALLTVLAGSSAVLVVALLRSRDTVTAIVEGLDGGVVGLVLLVALHLIYLPNLLLACASWMLGAGVTLGDGSLVSMSTTDVGLLPAIPAFGLVSPGAEGSSAAYWWLLVGVAAGAVAGLAVAWARPRARFDQTALVGGLAGVAAGLAVTVAAALGSGGLGSDRLAHVGARVGALVVFAPTLLGLAGMAAGLILGLVRRPSAPTDPETETP